MFDIIKNDFFYIVGKNSGKSEIWELLKNPSFHSELREKEKRNSDFSSEFWGENSETFWEKKLNFNSSSFCTSGHSVAISFNF